MVLVEIQTYYSIGCREEQSNMRTVQKETFKETTKALNKERNQYLLNKVKEVVLQEKRLPIKNEQIQDNPKLNHLSKQSSLALKKSQTMFSQLQNFIEYGQKEVGQSKMMSKQNVSQSKTESILITANQNSASIYHQFNRNDKKMQQHGHRDAKNEIAVSNQLTRSPQLTGKNQSILTSNGQIQQQISLKQLKSSKSVQLFDIKSSQLQTPTFQNIQLTKQSCPLKTQQKTQKMKLRDYLFMAKVSSEAAAVKKRMQRSNSKSNLQQSAPHELRHCLSQQSLLQKENAKPKRPSAKYATIGNDEMADILSQQIIQEILKLKTKVSQLQQWLSSTPKNESTQLSPFYLVRQDLKNANGSLDDMFKKIFVLQPQTQKQGEGVDMRQSIAISKFTNPNHNFTFKEI